MTQENEKLISGEETQLEEPMTPGGNSRAIIIPIPHPGGDPIDPGDPEDPDEPEETAIIGGDFVKNGVVIQDSFGSNSAFDVNLYKGRLFFTQHLFTAEGLHLPASFSVSYNKRFADTDYVHCQTTMFKGWKLNYQQFIRFAENKCVYVDGAFKEHIFEKSTNNANVYLDVSTQSGTILRPATDEETFADHVISDGANTQLFFKDDMLVKIRQTSGTTPIETTITHDNLNRVLQITDGLGETYLVNYVGDTVTITDSNDTVLVTLTANSNNRLTTVDYYEDSDSGKVCQFTYDPSTNLLSNVQDQLAQEKVIFAYCAYGALGAIDKYVIKGDTSTKYHSKTITYHSDHTIMAQSNGSTSADAQIRHKYTFNTDGSLANVCEIDTTGNAIGEQTFVTYENGVERHVSYKPAETISLWDEDWPAGIGPGVLIQGPIEVGNKTISIPNPNNNTMDVTFSWHMEYEDLFLPYPDSIITVEFLVNDSLVCTREYPVAETISLDETCTVKGIPTTTETRIVLRVTPPYSEQPVFISNVQATYRPYSEYKKEMYIKYTPPYDIMFANPIYMAENVDNEICFWFPIVQPQFIVDGSFIYLDTFTINDYTKTMQSYFLSGKYNFYYNDCRDVIYQATNVSLCYEDQDFELVDAPLEIMTKSIIPISFERISIEGSNLKISQRRYGSADNYCYSKLDTYLRPVTEFRAGAPAQTHQYDRFGNETELYSGGTTGIRSTSTYSTNGQSFIKNVDYIHTDTPTTEYEYNTDGLVSQITTPIDQEINFDYQNKNLLSRVSAVVDNQTNANDIVYDGLLITSLSHNGTSFQFVYDERNNISEVKVAGATLLSKTVTHSSNGSYFTQSTYANGQIIRKYYDKYDRLIKLSEGISEHVLATFIYSDEEVLSTVTEPTDPSLSISSSSKLRVVIDTSTSTTNRITYTYDDFGRVSKVEDNNMTITPTMDNFNRVEKVECDLDSDTIETTYVYTSTADDSLQSEWTKLNSLGKISTSYTKDTLQRPTETTVMRGGYGYKTTISYAPRQTKKWVKDDGPIPIIKGGSVGTNALDLPPISGHWETTTVGTTNHVWQFREYDVSGDTATLVRSNSVQYDANGNITQYGDVTYEYDKLNRLVRENNPGIDKTITWCYDVGGNIVSRTEYAYTTGTPSSGTTTNYTYKTDWKDQLDKIVVDDEEQQIFYDQAGNPTVYMGKSLNWTRGRLLSTYATEHNALVATMRYDASGIRIQKNVLEDGHTTTTNYIYNGNNLIQEAKSGASSNTKTYLYNSQGIVGFVQDGTTYTYRKNLFGDIVAIYNGPTKLVEYAYDALGNCVVIDPTTELPNEDADFIGNQNPFRYRGYYWDNDLQLYYLMSRHYDPQTGRFINADTLDYLEPENINGLNLYAYCSNNPVMYADPSGHSAILIGLIIGAIIGFGAAAYVDYQDDGEIFNGSVAWYDYLGATIVGGAIGAGFGYIAPAIAEFAATSFTIGSGLTISAGGTAAVTAGLTITGADILVITGTLGLLLMAEHTKNARPSTKNKHQKGQTHRLREKFGGEKGDARRTPRKKKRGHIIFLLLSIYEILNNLMK